MKKSLLLISGMVMLLKLPAQLKGAIEQLSYFSNDRTITIEPVMHIQTASGFYGAVHYNYEKEGALSLNAGKEFIIPGKIQNSFIPMLGIVAGSMSGYNIGLDHETEWKNFFFSSRSQYCRSFSKKYPGFFYTWVESGYNISTTIFAGVALQYRRQSKMSEAETGIMSGIDLKNVSVSFYVFNPACKDLYFVLGLNYEYSFKKRK